MSNTPLKTDFTRVWLVEGRARPDHTPQFLNFMKFDSVEQSFGEVTPIYEPSNSKYGDFDQVGSFRGDKERPSTSLVGHYAQAVKSKLLELALAGCELDLQMHIGQCEDPGVFNDFSKIVIFEGVIVENYSTDSLGALEPGERGKVDETGDVSAIRFYEFVPLAFAARTPSVVTNELLDVIICDASSCGDCEEESNGCQKIMAISKSAGGSPSTPADVVFSLDGGLTWLAHDIDTLGIAQDPAAIACVGSSVVVVATGAGDEMHIAPIVEFTSTDDPAFSLVTTGFVAGGEPTDIWSLGSIAYLCGLSGFIYKTDNPSSGVTVVDAGAATTSDLNAIYMLSETFGVAVGNDGVIVTINGDLASLLATSPLGIGTNFNSIWVKSETEWFVADDAGGLRRTTDGGVTWTTITLPGAAPTTVTDISMASASVMYVSATVAGKGEIYVSVDGGHSFIRAPRNSSGALPNNDGINAIASCEFDVDFIAGVGLAADAADGFIIIGND